MYYKHQNKIFSFNAKNIYTIICDHNVLFSSKWHHRWCTGHQVSVDYRSVVLYQGSSLIVLSTCSGMDVLGCISYMQWEGQSITPLIAWLIKIHSMTSSCLASKQAGWEEGSVCALGPLEYTHTASVQQSSMINLLQSGGNKKKAITTN